MIYIDFDGVILDTRPLLNKDIDFKNMTEKEYIHHLKTINWEKVLDESTIINDSIYYLKNMNPNETAICTKVHSLENEASSKIKYLRSKMVKQNVIVVPPYLKKTDVVNASGNILVDNGIFNLDDWSNENGIALFFDQYGNNIDSYGEENTKSYKRMYSLGEINNESNK